MTVVFSKDFRIIPIKLLSFVLDMYGYKYVTWHCVLCSLSINWICHQYLISKKEDRYNKRENTYCEWQSDLSPRDRTFFSIKIHNGYYFSLQSILSSMYIIVIRNHFLWEPHMQIYFYWLYDHIVNCIGFNRWNYLQLLPWGTYG